MGLILKADISCDHEGCKNKTTSSDISLEPYEEYGTPMTEVSVYSFDDDGWEYAVTYGRGGFSLRHMTKYFCPEHNSPSKRKNA